MNKNYLLYIGVFLAGAVITPLYLSIFNTDNGDRPAVESTEEPDLNLFDSAAPVASEATESGPRFEPNDSQEVLLNDYAVLQPSQSTPTSLPNYAQNQPAVAPYPDYSAIRTPRLQPSLSSPSPAVSNPGAIAKEPVTTSSPEISPSFSDTIHSLPANVFLPPTTAPDANTTSQPFNGGFQTSDNFNLESLLGNPIPVPEEKNNEFSFAEENQEIICSTEDEVPSLEPECSKDQP